MQGKERQKVAFAITLWGQPSARARQTLDCPVLAWEEVMTRGKERQADFLATPVRGDTIATHVYTSGTSGSPKVRPAGADRRSTRSAAQLRGWTSASVKHVHCLDFY